MHDLHLAQQIADLAKKEAHKNGLSKIEKIVIGLGNVIEHNEAIVPENLKFNIGLLLPDTEVEIHPIDGNIWKLKEIEGK